MICKFCGNEIEDGSDFCFICGQKVEASEAPATAPSEAAAETAVAVAPAEAAEEPKAAVEAAPEAPAPVLDPKAAKKAAKKARAGKFAKFIAFLFAIIGLLMYRSAKKNGYEEKATSILNAVMLGLDVKMVVVIGYLVKTFML